MAEIDKDWLKKSVDLQLKSGDKRLPQSNEVREHALEEEKSKINFALNLSNPPTGVSQINCN